MLTPLPPVLQPSVLERRVAQAAHARRVAATCVWLQRVVPVGVDDATRNAAIELMRQWQAKFPGMKIYMSYPRSYRRDVQYILKSRGMSQRALQGHTGVPQGYISLWLRYDGGAPEHPHVLWAGIALVRWARVVLARESTCTARALRRDASARGRRSRRWPRTAAPRASRSGAGCRAGN